MKVILQGDDDLLGQAMVARQAIKEGRPEIATHGKFYRIFEDERSHKRWVAVYNKRSITIYPQR